MIIKEKGKLLNKILSLGTELVSNKKNIIFYAPIKFHASHFEAIISRLLSNNKINLFLVGEFDKNLQCRHYEQLTELPIYRKYHAFVATELLFPWRLNVKTIFFGHGIGPKIDYQKDKILNRFDYSFCPTQSIFDTHKSADVIRKKIGLPLLDAPNGANEKNGIYQAFNLQNDLPLIVHAPSWNTDIDRISDISKIMECLKKVKNYNIIVSPHPNLFLPKRCEGKSYYDNSTLPINLPQSQFSTFTLCQSADIVISDISSILYEAMALNKDVLFDGNELVYNSSGAGHILEDLKKAIPTIDWNDDIDKQMEEFISNERTEASRSHFIDQYLFNRGKATDAFENALWEVINIKTI